MPGWFDVDKDGLRKLHEGKGKIFVLWELISNAMDEASKKVQVMLEPIEGRRERARIVFIDDNPEGFKDIRHAYTLFAESLKKDDPEKRGRFNLGEKLVLALCEEAAIYSVKDSVAFDADGTRRALSKSKNTEEGSRFEAVIRMKRDEIEDIHQQIHMLIPTPGVEVSYNGEAIQQRDPVRSFETSLPTVKSDEEGILRPTTRKTLVNVYLPREGEIPMLYEIGIPVVESGIRFHVDVRQKVPLNQDRDNVTPTYYRQVCREVLNHTYDIVEEEATTDTWVKIAMEDEKITQEAFQETFKKQFGDKVVTYDPSDPEANNRAIANGYMVLHGRQLSAEAWNNARRFASAPAAGRMFATPKPYSPDGDPTPIVPKDKWTEGMQEVVALSKRLAEKLLYRSITVTIVMDMGGGAAACYGHGSLDFCLKRLGHNFFNNWNSQHGREALYSILIHEFAHEFESNHLSEGFYKALQKLGARMTKLALEEPEVFQSTLAKA